MIQDQSFLSSLSLTSDAPKANPSLSKLSPHSCELLCGTCPSSLRTKVFHQLLHLKEPQKCLAEPSVMKTIAGKLRRQNSASESDKETVTRQLDSSSFLLLFILIWASLMGRGLSLDEHFRMRSFKAEYNKRPHLFMLAFTDVYKLIFYFAILKAMAADQEGTEELESFLLLGLEIAVHIGVSYGFYKEVLEVWDKNVSREDGHKHSIDLCIIILELFLLLAIEMDGYISSVIYFLFVPLYALNVGINMVVGVPVGN